MHIPELELLEWAAWITKMSSTKDKELNPARPAIVGMGGIFIFASLVWGMMAGPLLTKQKTAMSQATPIPANPQNERPPYSWLALGDSYTIGESVEVSARYPVQSVGILQRSGIRFTTPLLIAKTGWTTGDLLEALREEDKKLGSFDLVTLLIGVNNQYQGLPLQAYGLELTSLLKKAIELAAHQASHVIVLSIPDYAITPFARHLNGSRISSEIDGFNRFNREIALNFGVNYLDITAESRKAALDPSLIAGDGLHFSGKEYEVWARLLSALIRARIK
jgi:lysophospholipase L1-like esterase